jgi:hypothetical protein
MRLSTLAATAIVLLFAATSASAADNYESAPEKGIASAAMMVTYSTTFVVQMYDAHTTIRALDAGAREMNPLLSPSSSDARTVIAVGLVRATVIDLALRSIAKRNKWAAVAAGAGINSAYLVVAAHNNRVANGMRAQAARR